MAAGCSREVELADDGERHDAAEGGFSEHGDRGFDGADFAIDSVNGRVDEAQQAIGERGIASNEITHFMDVDGIVIELSHNFEVGEAVGGNLTFLE